jgi:5'-nucleotidase
VAALAAGALLLAPAVAMLPAAAEPDGSDVVINELYARGGSANQPYTNKFVELYNPTGEDIELDGMSLQYRSATGPNFSVQARLEGTIPAGGYYLVQGGSNGSNGVALPTPDFVAGGLNPSGTNGVVALVDGTSAITLPAGDAAGAVGVVDLVGTGSANVFETAAAANQGGNSDPLSWQRAAGGADSDNNAADFTMAAPTPQASGDDTDPDPDPTEEPTEPGTVTPIAEIQGTGASSPLVGRTVTTRGVVTGVYPTGGFGGVYLQTAGTGADLAGHTASHGIFVYGGGNNSPITATHVGDHLEVTGAVSEYFGLTQITAARFTVLDEPGTVTPAAIELPATEAERERYEGMLLAPQGDFTITDTYHTNRFGWLGLAAGDEPLRQPTDVVRPGTPEYTALVAANAERYVRLDDGSSNDLTSFGFADHTIPVPYIGEDVPVRVGADVEFTRPVILDFRRTVANEDGTWNLQPQTRLTGANSATVQPITWEDTRPAAPEEVGGDIQVATFNVLNYFTSLGVDEAGCGFYPDRQGNPTTARNCDVRGAYDEANLARQEVKIVNAITALGADVLALQEIENSRHFNAAEDRDVALGDLVDALNERAGAGTWAYVASPEDVPADEDVIRNAFIYRTDAVVPVGESEILIGDAAFANAREPLAQEFAPLDDAGEVVEDAETFVLVVNHFKSKGSGVDAGDGQGAANLDRVAQAEALAEFADDVAADRGTDLVLLMGDFNSYAMEDPIVTLRDAGYTDLVAELTDEHTYSFGSMVGSLDHILASEAAFDAVTGADVWNINAYESIGLEYSRYNYNVTDLYDEGVYRSSDHDPILVGLDLYEDEAPALVEVTADTRCVAGKVVQTVRVANTAGTWVEATISTPYGSRTVTLDSGRAASAAFSSRLASVPAGTATVAALHEGGTSTVTAAYDARSCG